MSADKISGGAVWWMLTR